MSTRKLTEDGQPVACPVCGRAADGNDLDPKRCRHPMHWPDIDPVRPYFPDAVAPISTYGEDDYATATDLARTALAFHLAMQSDMMFPGPDAISEASYVASCYAADIRAAGPDEYMAVIRRWVTVT